MRNETRNSAQPVPTGRRQAQKKAARQRRSRLIWCIVRRFLLVFFSVILGVLACLILVMNLIFNGPSPSARDRLTMSLRESSGMKWCPALFLGEEKVAEIEKASNFELPDELSDNSKVNIDLNSSVSGSDRWADAKDGILLEYVSGDTYNAYVMMIRDPSRVYLATSTDKFSMDIPGTRIDEQMKKENAVAAINAGAFWDNGKASSQVGSVPEDLVISEGTVRWPSGSAPEEGFVGFNNDNILVVAQSMDAKRAMELGIRDGCCFGPVLIMNGEINMDAYNSNSGLNPRTALGQCADGTVIFLCIDGRQLGSMGGTYADIIDIMVEYGVVNACNLDGGSSTVMMQRDYDTGEIKMINSYSLLQEKPRRMPTFYMVRPSSED